MSTTKPNPGFKTTEFWITLAISIGQLSAALAGVLPPKYAAILIAVSGVSYKLSRGLAKSGGKNGSVN